MTFSPTKIQCILCFIVVYSSNSQIGQQLGTFPLPKRKVLCSKAAMLCAVECEPWHTQLQYHFIDWIFLFSFCTRLLKLKNKLLVVCYWHRQLRRNLLLEQWVFLVQYWAFAPICLIICWLWLLNEHVCCSTVESSQRIAYFVLGLLWIMVMGNQ